MPDLHIARIDGSHAQNGMPRIITSHRGYTADYQRVVYVVPDVRDAMTSRFHFLNRERVVFSDFDRFLRHPQFEVASWAEHVRSWLDSPTNRQGRCLLVRYQDLLDAPVVELPRLGELLNVRMSDEALEWMVAMSGKDRISRLEAVYGRARPSRVPLRKGEKGQWRNEYTEAQLKLLHREAGTCMERCGCFLEDQERSIPVRSMDD